MVRQFKRSCGTFAQPGRWCLQQEGSAAAGQIAPAPLGWPYHDHNL